MAAFSNFDDIPLFSYQMIMADPPWSFENWSDNGKEKSPDAHYQCRDLDWIKSLNVGHLADKDCILWLWACNPMLDQALEVIKAWGFQFITAGSWNKKTINGKYRWGTGYVLRSTNEPYLIATNGKQPSSRAIPSAWDGVVREHSRKPEEGFAWAEKMLPNAKRLELFSRQEREGWDVFGDQINKFQVSSVAIDETPAAGAVSVPPILGAYPVAGDPNLSRPAQTPSPVSQPLNQRGAGVFS